jgi:hypothetical protein
MDNPWRHLPKRFPYVLPADAAAVDRANKRPGEERRLHTEKLPEPYIGDPNTPIVLLTLNGRFEDDDYLFTLDPVGRALQLANLRHDPADYPFYHLDPRIKTFGGATYWRPRFEELIGKVGLEVVAHGVFCVEFFPYSSRTDAGIRDILDSQRYGFQLVEQAIDRDALIVLMRSRTEWCAQVPRLASYDQLHTCTSPRKPYINRVQLPVAFPEIVRLLRA